MDHAPNSSSPTGYTRFDQSLLWDRQRGHYLAAHRDIAEAGDLARSGPLLHRAYADLALAYWRDLKRRFAGNCPPLHILELGAGAGLFAKQFLATFTEAFDSERDSGDRFCYVMSDIADHCAAAWRRDPELDRFVQLGILEFAQLDVESTQALGALRLAGRPDAPSLAPPIVIANGVFSKTRQALFHLDKDTVLESWVALETDGPGLAQDAAAVRIDFVDRPVDAAPASPLGEVLLRRAAAKEHGYLSYSIAADALITHCERTYGGLLLLSADLGNATPAARLPDVPPWIAPTGPFHLAVDYALLAERIRSASGHSWSTQAGPVAVFAGLIGLGAGDDTVLAAWRATAYAARTVLERGVLGAMLGWPREDGAESATPAPAQMLAMLRACDWNQALLHAWAPELRRRLGTLPYAEQCAWADALEALRRTHGFGARDCAFGFALALLAAELNRWTLTIGLLNELVQPAATATVAGYQRRIHYNLAIAHWQLADLDQAERHLEAGLGSAARQPGASGTSDPSWAQDDAQLRAALAALRGWRAHCADALGAVTRPPGLHDDDRVYVTPAGVHHAPALYRLQSDRALASAARVDCLGSVEEARDWLVATQNSGEQLFVILHRRWGMVGLVSLLAVETDAHPAAGACGYFYFWIAPAFQGQGFGTQALRLLADICGEYRIDHLFSLVAQGNAVSRAALSRAGFVRLPFEVRDADPGLRYHYHGNARDTRARHALLLALLQDGGFDEDLLEPDPFVFEDERPC